MEKPPSFPPVPEVPKTPFLDDPAERERNNAAARAFIAETTPEEGEKFGEAEDRRKRERAGRFFNEHILPVLSELTLEQQKTIGTYLLTNTESRHFLQVDGEDIVIAVAGVKDGKLIIIYEMFGEDVREEIPISA